MENSDSEQSPVENGHKPVESLRDYLQAIADANSVKAKTINKGLELAKAASLKSEYKVTLPCPNEVLEDVKAYFEKPAQKITVNVGLASAKDTVLTLSWALSETPTTLLN